MEKIRLYESLVDRPEVEESLPAEFRRPDQLLRLDEILPYLEAITTGQYYECGYLEALAGIEEFLKSLPPEKPVITLINPNRREVKNGS